MKINTYDDFCSYIYVSRETYEKLLIFKKTLIKWQNKINLISQATIENIWERHFLDSAQLYPFLKDINGNVLDFGSGAGFPGLILAMMGKKNIHLIEADLKKCVFLREVVMLTGIDTTIHNSRIENFNYIKVELITARALASLSKLIFYVENYIIKGQKKQRKIPKLLFLKGKSYNSEILELSKIRNFTYKIYPSLTDKNSKIIYIDDINKLKNDYEK